MLLPKAQGKGNRRSPQRQRELLNAMFYVVRTACQWRNLPKDFAPWRTVYHYFRLWKRTKLWVQIHTHLREHLRQVDGRQRQATAGIIAESRPELPGVEIVVEAVREYPEGRLVSQILGYTGPISPEQYQDLRSEMVLNLEKVGMRIEVHHHEVGTAGQAEIDIRYGTLLATADNIMKYKYVVKNTARQAGKTVTFMPKPIFMDNGSGMHTHQSIWKGKRPLFAGNQYADLSETALYYIGGIIRHAKAINAFTNPTTNSYKRLIPGFEAPVLLAYSARNRSASCRMTWLSPCNRPRRR